MILSSNIIYRTQVTENDASDKRLINSNEILEKKLTEYGIEAERKKREELLLHPTPLLDENGEAVLDEEGNPRMQQPEPEELPEENPVSEQLLEEAKEEAETLLQRAHDEADEILATAKGQAEALKKHMEEEGRKEGYQRGLSQAETELTEKRAEIKEEEKRLLDRYEKEEEDMEQKLVDVICQVVDRVFKIQFSDKKEILLHLVDNAISNIDGSREFQIRVNDNGYGFLNQNKDKLQEKLGEGIQLDILLDPLLNDNQCMIETDGGIFDCSMDTQLENLLKDMKSLSSQ